MLAALRRAHFLLLRLFIAAHVLFSYNSALFELNFDSTYFASAKNLVFFIKEISVNAAKTSFDVSMSFANAGERSVYTYLSVNVLLIGSDFSGYSNSVESSFIYTKMSQLEYVTDYPEGGGVPNVAQFDFKNGNGDTSPFDYLADADFGYVGGAPNKINLYVGKTAVKFNIAADEAVERLIDLIREHGKWIDAPEPAPAEA